MIRRSAPGSGVKIGRVLLLILAALTAVDPLFVWARPQGARVDIGAFEHTTGSPPPLPPASPVKLVFIHHSSGENWLADDNGGLGFALQENNYFVSDTNYGWGPDAIGDLTDIGHWYNWFSGPDHETYLDALYAESAQHSSYSRMTDDPGGPNEIILFKSCFPNSHLAGSPEDPPTTGENPLRGQGSGSEFMTVGNAKGIYSDILTYFAAHQEKLFVAVTAPPLAQGETDASHAANARAFNNWLVNSWLAEYPYRNVTVFDFYNVLTSNGGNADMNDVGQETGNHHRWWNGGVQHIQTVNSNTAAYPSAPHDSHPRAAGNQKATAEFVALLNFAFNRWNDHDELPLNADFSASPASGMAPLRVAFIDLSTGQVAERQWNFGDGSTSTLPNPTHDYTVPGTYTVSLTVIDPDLASDTEVKTDCITVTAPIIVTAPGAGETWYTGTTQKISWSYEGNPGKQVRIELLKSGVTLQTIQERAKAGKGGAGSYNWKIPASLAPADDYRIRVTSLTGPEYSGTSANDFTVSGPKLTLTTPNGGETWYTGTTQKISWSYEGDPGKQVKIELLKGGVTLQTIREQAKAGKGGAGSYNWKIPASLAPADDYAIKVTSRTYAPCTDMSNTSFSLSSP